VVLNFSTEENLKDTFIPYEWKKLLPLQHSGALPIEIIPVDFPHTS